MALAKGSIRVVTAAASALHVTGRSVMKRRNNYLTGQI